MTAVSITTLGMTVVQADSVLIQVIITLHVLFWIFDRLPFFYLAFSVFCHLVYSMNLKTFPFISLTSIPFIGSCVLVFADHFLWFKYFTTHYRPFMDIAAFFGLCVWLIPFAYFISLSANDNTLPTGGGEFYFGEERLCQWY